MKVAEEMMGGKWIEYSVGDSTLAIANVSEQWAPSDQGASAAFEVGDFDEAIKHLKDEQVPFQPSHSRRRAVAWPLFKILTATNSSFTN
jgi:hypothetical protein